MKILVIDDEKPTLSMFRLFLAAYGYEVHTASDGEEGLALFNTLRPDIVFTDIRMPGMDGLEVLGRIRRADPDCQVIIITGHGDMNRALDAMDMDASDFINKPVERQALNSALLRAEKRSLGDGNKAFGLALETDSRFASGGNLCRVTGRLTGEGQAALGRVFEGMARGEVLVMDFDPEFSIDRSGMALLTAVLQRAVEKGIHLEMKGLGFNYIRFFEMAGIHKFAKIHPADVQEPGL
ncbi:MAG: response regulator [Desulfobacter sp.]|nr:MAG: response regulator [Desulfobacter sp.]